MTQISIFRTSFIWVETVPAILAKQVPAGADCAFLGEYGGYAVAFDQCQSGKPAGGGRLTLPWKTPQGNLYWRYYFEGTHAGDMTGAQAWKKLVPFRADVPTATVSPDPKAKVSFEAFYAPQGIAVVALVNYRGDAKPVLDIAALARAVRYDYRFQIGGSTVPPGISLDRAADSALALARQQAFGKVDGSPGNNQPFSVTTFLVGDSVVAPTQGSDEHFLLETVTSWDRSLKTADLAGRELAGAQLPIRGANNENMMYARDRGRAIWMGRVFGENPATSLLACYHSNVTHASLQTLMLGEFVSWVAAEYALGRTVAPAIKDRAKRAASLLELFATGATATGRKVTYRSASVVAQMKSADWTKSIASVKALP